MLKMLVLVTIVCLLGMDAASIVCSQETGSSYCVKGDKPRGKEGVKHELPTDQDGEERDYAVLEATLDDLASPKNPEYKNWLQHAEPGREIVINIRTRVGGELTDLFLLLDRPNRNIDGADPRNVPRDIQEEFKRRSRSPVMSLTDFKPTNAKIIVADLDSMLEGPRGILDDGLGAIRRKYPTAWGYVWAYPPSYSKDGKSAIVVFDEPSGPHGGDWVYMLSKQAKGWEVVWRHLHIYR